MGGETSLLPKGSKVKLSRAEAARQARQAKVRAKALREKESDEARGPPPAPARDFRLPMHLVPDLLVTWELLQVCSPSEGKAEGQSKCVGTDASALPLVSYSFLPSFLGK